jgi:ribosomal protein L37AE/L43A
MDKETVIKIKPEITALRQGGMTCAKIGKQFELTKGQVKYIIGVNYSIHTCPACGKEFLDRNGAKFCSQECGYHYRYTPRGYSTKLERVTAKISPPDNNGCWNWLGTVGTISGYGMTSLGGKNQNAHRYIMTLICGDFPKDLFVLHKCDNRLCVNPNHLYLGTVKDNARDRVRRGRGNSGHRFSKEAVWSIRKTYKRPYDLKSLSQTYGVSKSAIWQIVIGKSYPNYLPKPNYKIR